MRTVRTKLINMGCKKGVYLIGEKPLKLVPGQIVRFVGDGIDVKVLTVPLSYRTCGECPLSREILKDFHACRFVRYTKNNYVYACQKINKHKRVIPYIGFQSIDDLIEDL